jgi:ferric-dicitrate binding protein FerR (iron transport regulator)
VAIGRAKAYNGATVLPGDVITTSNDSSAWIRFRSPASTIMLANTEAVVGKSTLGPSLELRRGTLVVDKSAMDAMRVAIPGGFVLVRGNEQFPAQCELALVGNSSTVSVKGGRAEIYGAGEPVILHAGQAARMEAGGQQGGAQVAGKVFKEIPEGVLLRQGQGEEIPLKLDQEIDWNDVIHTMRVGRAQLLLLDGTTLNYGCCSATRIVKHDPKAQQTSIELSVGKVLAEVKEITTPGGKFQLNTKNAVIGVIDTSFVVETDDTKTRVCGVSGTTEVKSTNPNNPKTVKLHKNECTVVWAGMAPTDPVYSPAETASLMSQTGIQGATAAGIPVPGGAAGGVGIGMNTRIALVAIPTGAAIGIVYWATSGGAPVSPSVP